MASKKFTELPAVTTDPNEDSVIAVSVFDGVTTYTSEKLTLKQVNKASSNAFATLTDSATVTWDMDVSDNAEVTITADRTLAISNAKEGHVGILKVIQDGTGGWALTLPANSKVSGGGAGAITLSSPANSEDVLSYIYDGTDYLWTYGRNYN